MRSDMERLNRLAMALLAITTHALHAPAQQVVFAHADGWAAAPALAIDSIKATQPPMLDVFLAGKAVSVQADTMYMNRDVPDHTLHPFP